VKTAATALAKVSTVLATIDDSAAASFCREWVSVAISVIFPFPVKEMGGSRLNSGVIQE
jgi:hypothetical protein